MSDRGDGQSGDAQPRKCRAVWNCQSGNCPVGELFEYRETDNGDN